LAQREGSVTQRVGVMTSARDEAASRRGKGRDNDSWAGENLTGPKNKENQRARFNWYKWMVKI
jgi:hypothetical protein